MSERISLDRKEFEAFLVENQALVGRSEKLIEKIDSLQKINRNIEEELRATKEKLESIQADLNTEVRQADDSLRQARATIARLLKETEKRISQ
jgi:predicted  nucleic acid-binding Zn-ribbon protein